jgi:hypothetical protein
MYNRTFVPITTPTPNNNIEYYLDNQEDIIFELMIINKTLKTQTIIQIFGFTIISGLLLANISLRNLSNILPNNK